MDHGGILLVVIFVVILAWFTVMQWYGKLPSVQSFRDFAEVVNTRGGNITILLFMSIAFFVSAMRLFYWTVDKMADGKLSPDNAMVLAGWAFVTGMAFGGANGAMLNTMTGTNGAKTEVHTTSPGEINVETKP